MPRPPGRQGPSTPVTPGRLDELETQARFARQRYDLYRARAYGPRPTSPGRLRELERECTRAEEALRFARAELKRSSPG
jgi:hypothetical protein